MVREYVAATEASKALPYPSPEYTEAVARLLAKSRKLMARFASE